MSNEAATDDSSKGWFSFGKWQPTTNACGFIHASLEDTLYSFMDWKTPLVAKYKATLRTHEVQGTFDDAFTALLPLKAVQPDKYLFLPTSNNEWTAIFDNCRSGTEPHSLVAVMNRLYGHNAIEAIDIPNTLSNDTMAGSHGCVAFIYQYNKTYERWVRTIHNHSGWQFGTYGEPLPFEDLTLFDKPHPKDRFDHDALLRYLLTMGIDASNESFYMPNGRAIIVEEYGQDFSTSYA